MTASNDAKTAWFATHKPRSKRRITGQLLGFLAPHFIHAVCHATLGSNLN